MSMNREILQYWQNGAARTSYFNYEMFQINVLTQANHLDCTLCSLLFSRIVTLFLSVGNWTLMGKLRRVHG